MSKSLQEQFDAIIGGNEFCTNSESEAGVKACTKVAQIYAIEQQIELIDNVFSKFDKLDHADMDNLLTSKSNELREQLKQLQEE